MPPNTEEDDLIVTEEKPKKRLVGPQAAKRVYEIIYFNILVFSYWHIASFYGLYLCVTSAKWSTIFLNFLFFMAAQIGLSVGAHRLWSHKCFKAKLPLEIILILFNSIAFQNTAFDWIRNHRLHHKFTDTDADPHNATRGLFYSHIGWLLVRKHPEVLKQGKTTNMSDIYSNPVLMFQKKYAIPMIGTMCFALPTLMPMYFWGETLKNAWHIALLRYLTNFHCIGLINSVAHRYGNRPYDQRILPTENSFVTFFSMGDGYHNYHHTFPYDYRSDELGFNMINFSTMFIDFFVWIGWAYDLRTASKDLIKKRAARTGDGTDLYGRNFTKDEGKIESKPEQ